MQNPYPINTYIPVRSDIFNEIQQIVADNAPLVAKLSGEYRTPEQIRTTLAQMTQSVVDDSVTVNLPFYSDFGRHITLGKNVFINTGAMFTDFGGITIDDNVLIAPRVNIITVNHPLNPDQRQGLLLSPVHIKKNVWIGAGATILAGVTIGENAVVGAGSLVTKDVPDNAVVVGSPAKVVKMIDE